MNKVFTQKRVQNLEPSEMAVYLFMLTGNHNYFLLYNAIECADKELEWNHNLESREL